MIGSQNSLEKCDETEKTPLKNVTCYNVGFMNGILTLPDYMAPLMAKELSDE